MIKSVVAIMVIAFCIASAQQEWQQKIVKEFEKANKLENFKNWKKVFEKTYASKDDENKAYDTWLANWRMINEFNLNGGKTYKLKMNQFGDMNKDQFKKYVNGKTGSCLKGKKLKAVKKQRQTPKKSAPSSIDWTNVDGLSYVTAVKNQGQCGSCWAFSSTGAIESRTAIATKTTGSSIQTLSEQELVDCSKLYGNLGCNGGDMDAAFKYVAANGGLCSEKEYPYTAKTGTCEKSKCATKYDEISGHKDVTDDSETALVDALAEGPVSIGIEADQEAFQFYSSGILSGKCGTKIDHGVLAVGYGTDNSEDFWKVKNSWGTSWGEDGYLRICRNCDKNGKEGECGILSGPVYPISSKAKKTKRHPIFLLIRGFLVRFGF